MPTDLKPLRRLTQHGRAAFESFVDGHSVGDRPSRDLIDGSAFSEPFADGVLDAARQFASRFEFGEYLVAQLAALDAEMLLAPEADDFWAWVAALYFEQLSAPTQRSRKPKKREHFLVVRQGFKGSLHYRHGPRTAFEMVRMHGEYARVCLAGPMGEFGDMAEQLTSRFNIAHDTGYFRAACKLYLKDGKLVHGAASRAKKPSKRKPNERAGMGGAGRLAKALNRLTLTYDTAEMSSDGIVAVLPREFDRFKSS